MLADCEHHAHCARTRNPTLTQRTLISVLGLLSLSSSPQNTCRRTPLSHAIRRIANTPTFSTTDPSLTSFLRFPPEIRSQIYGLLLKSKDTIEYSLCPIKQRFVSHRRSRWQGWIRHGLFPSILECCRTTNREGSAVLYGENWFHIERSGHNTPVLDSWGPGRVNLDSITMLTLTYGWWSDCVQDRKIVEIMDLLPGLREVKIKLFDLLVEEWEAFLVEVSGKLGHMRKVVLEMDVSHEAGTAMWQRQWPASQSTDEERCFWRYGQPFKKHEGAWRHRGVRWEFDACTNDFERSHGVLGTVRLVLG